MTHGLHKLLFIILCALGIGIFSGTHARPLHASSLAKTYQAAQKAQQNQFQKFLHTLQQIETVDAELRKQGYKEIYIAGGSAKSILDFLRKQTSIKLRDIDFVLINPEKNSASTKALTFQLIKHLEEAGIGKLIPNSMRGRPRSYPSVNAGYGFHLHNGFNDVDISVFHDWPHANYNGILNTSKVMIPTKNLRSRLYELSRHDFEHTTKLLHDPHEGYRAWIRKSPKIVDIREVRSNPIKTSLRISKEFLKMNTRMPKEIQTLLRTEVTQVGKTLELPKRLSIVRELLKVFEHHQAAELLKAWSDIGGLAFVYKDLDRYVQTHSIDNVRQTLREAASHPPKVKHEHARGLSTLSHFVHTGILQNRELFLTDLATLGLPSDVIPLIARPPSPRSKL